MTHEEKEPLLVDQPVVPDESDGSEETLEGLIGFNEEVAQRFRRRIRLDYRWVIRRLLQASAFSPGDRILDIGLEDGSLVFQIVSRVAPGQVVCACPEEKLLQKLYRQAQSVGLEEQIDWRLAPIEALGFPEATFDVITCAQSFRLLPTRLFVKEAHRLLVPGGRLVFTESLVPQSKATHWRVAGRSLYYRYIAKDEAEADASYYTADEIGNILHETGFQPILIYSLQKPLSRASWVYSLVKAVK